MLVYNQYLLRMLGTKQKSAPSLDSHYPSPQLGSYCVSCHFGRFDVLGEKSRTDRVDNIIKSGVKINVTQMRAKGIA